jgi:hypothetical protein
VVLSLSALACGDDASSPPGPFTGAERPIVLPTLGLGPVAERFTSELTVRGSYAYTGTWGRRVGATRDTVAGNVIKVWNVAGDAPRLVDSVVVPDAGTVGDVQVSDDRRLLVAATESRSAPGSLVVYDLADPARPRLLARHTSPNVENGVHTAEVARVNGRLHAFLSVDPSPSRLVVVDLTDPAAPREVLTMTVGSPGVGGELVHDVYVRDGILFVAGWNLGLSVWDIGGGGRGGTVAAPLPLGAVQTVGGAVHNVAWFHDPSTGSARYAFVGEENMSAFGAPTAGDIHVVDVSDLAQPREVAFFRVPGAGTHNFSLDERSGVLYAAYYNAGVRALDVRGDLAGCAAAERAPDGRCDLALMGREVARGPAAADVYVWGVQHAGGALYASDLLNGLWKLDASALRR